MAKMNIYVPDGLKAEMDALGDGRVNWSSEAQRSFETAIQRTKWPKEPTMEDVIERLRASKVSDESAQRSEGTEHGRKWAMLRASYRDLKRLATVDLHGYPEGSAWEIVDLSFGATPGDPESSFWWDLRNGDLGGFEPPDDAYVEGFLEGATEVWDKVENQV